MAVYSIKEIALLSGIKAHTIRIWEKRYNMFSPNRTDTNIRRYSDDDLRLALNISLLLNMGYKISRIARMSDEEKSSIVSKGNQYTSPPPVPESLFVAAMNLDKDAFSKKINETIESRGLEWTFENLIVPFQKRMGLLWQAGTVTPAQEHFSSNLLREVLINAAIGVASSSKTTNKKILFFLPEGEFHEIGLLYFNYVASSEGFHTIYLGQNVPIADVVEVATKQGIEFLFSSFTISLPQEVFLATLDSLQSSVPKAKIFLTGYQVEQNSSNIPSKITKISSAQQFRNIIQNF